MEIGRFLLFLISNIEPLISVMIFCAGITVLATGVLYFLARDAWFDKASFRVTGIFYGLSGYDCWRIAISWLRFLMTIWYVAVFKEIEPAGYVAYAIIGLFYIFDVRKPSRIFKNTLWVAIVTAGLFAVDLVGGYIRTLLVFDWKVWVVYVFMSIFMCLFAYYLFIQEIDEISSDRHLDPEKEYERTVRENSEQ